MTTVSSTQCLCNHLTSFASDFFVVPNLIDIRKVGIGFRNFDENYSTTVVLASIIGIYILLLVFLRRKDEMDKSKVHTVYIL